MGKTKGMTNHTYICHTG